MSDQLFYFSDIDRDKLGEIAETARAMIHTRPFKRGDFDAWQAKIKSLVTLPEPPEANPVNP